MAKLNEPGETVESIFSEVEHTCATQETEETDQLQDGSSEDEQMGELEMEMGVAGEKLVTLLENYLRSAMQQDLPN